MHELIDIGANLTSRQFARDRDKVIARASAVGVRQLIVTGIHLRGSRAASELARTRPGVLFSTAGVHPHNARHCDDHTLPELRALAARPEVVAVGECGLDYDRNFSPPVVQRRWFAAQLSLAAELGKPVFLHERAAHADFVAIVREHRDALTAGVVHCFTGTGEALDAYLELDLHIGITGWICDDRRGAHLRGLVGRVPATRLMIETDAPFLIPRDLTPRPPSRRNEPAYLPHILHRVAASVRRSPALVARQTRNTARALFGV